MYDRLCHNIKFTSLIMASYRRFPSPHYGIIIEVRSTLWHNGILIPRYDSIIKEGFDLTLWHHKMSINMESSAGTLFMSAQDKETRLPLTRARVHTATIPNKTDASVYRPPNTIIHRPYRQNRLTSWIPVLFDFWARVFESCLTRNQSCEVSLPKTHSVLKQSNQDPRHDE